MDEADADQGQEGKRDRTSTGGDVPAWTDLFERAAPHGVGEATVREALARRREGADE